MVTNKVYVNNRGIGREATLAEVEHMSEYLKLPRKSKLHIRLLTEEMLGMTAEIGGDFDAEFWAESEGKTCRLYLEAEMNKMSLEKKEALINVSTSGKNAAVKGMMSKLKDIMEFYWLGYKEGMENTTGIDTVSYTMAMSSTPGSMSWTLSDYKENIERQKYSGKAEEWDELEKSIVANLADDVSVGVKGETVMLVITKSI